MTPADRLRIADHMITNRENLRMERVRILTQLAENEKAETKLTEQFSRAFPDLNFDEPASRWTDLTANEQLMVHFLAHEGHLRRVPAALSAYRESTGHEISECGFRTQLSRLRAKRVVERHYCGWSVSAAILPVALNPPVVPKAPCRTGFDGMRQRANVLQAYKGANRGSDLEPIVNILPAPVPKPGDVYAHVPLDAPINLTTLTLAVEGEMSGTGLARTRACVRSLIAQGLLYGVGTEAYARRLGPNRPNAPTPALREVWRHVPEQGGISKGDLLLLVEGDTSDRARWRLRRRVDRLIEQGWIRRVGYGQYARSTPGDKPQACGTIETPEADDHPDVECPCDAPSERTYRRVTAESQEKIGLLRHFVAGSTLRLAEIVIKEEGKVSGSGLGRVRGELERLVAERRLEKVGGGYKLPEHTAMDRASRRGGMKAYAEVHAAHSPVPDTRGSTCAGVQIRVEYEVFLSHP